MKTNTNTASKPASKRVYMDVDVILTFDTPNSYGETQEFFDLLIPVSSHEVGADVFFDNKFFKCIVKKCNLLNRKTTDLVKISTASSWSIFKEKTGLPSLPEIGHNCKWHFGNGRSDLDPWETYLSAQYGFGTSVDMSWINEIYKQRQLSESEASISI